MYLNRMAFQLSYLSFAWKNPGLRNPRALMAPCPASMAIGALGYIDCFSRAFKNYCFGSSEPAEPIARAITNWRCARFSPIEAKRNA
jgi:hypothetical protein